MSEERHLEIERESGFAIAKLPQQMDLLAAEDLKQGLVAILEDHAPCKLDVTAVERVTTPCIQVLLAFVRDAEQADLPVEFSGKSEALTAAIARLGLAREFKHM